jgi:hypothetical protein
MKFIGITVFAVSAFLLVACGGDKGIEGKAESAVNKMCGCTDVKCFDAAEKELKAVGQEIEKKEKELSKESLEKLGKLKDKSEKCADDLASKLAGGGGGKGKGDKAKGGLTEESVVKQIKEIADKVCKCSDQDCAMLAMSEIADVGGAAEKAGLDLKSMEAEANKHVDRAGECMGKLP